MTHPLDDIVRDWVTANVGEVRSFDRQHRWRPAWFVVASRAGRPVRLYARGDREGFGSMDVAREALILKVMEAHSIPVPHIHAEIGDGAVVVMDWLAGESNLGVVTDPGEIDAVMDDYVDALVAVHRIDPQAFGGLGMAVPATREAMALDFFEGFVTRYRSFKRRPEPLLEFAIGWLRRNVPSRASRPSFVLGDSGQFMFENRRITGLLDVELAHIGDVAHDLAGLRLRGVTEPMGDLSRVLARYESVSGEPLDVAAIEFHTAKFALCTPLGLVAALHLDLTRPEILQYVEWFHQLSLHAIESIARQAGVQLEPVASPVSTTHEYTGVVRGLATMIEELDVAAGLAEYHRGTVASVARFCDRVNELHPAIVSADLDDIATLTGDRPVDRFAGDTVLEDFVRAAGPEHDANLISLLHRRCMRQMLLLEPVLTAPGGIGHLAALT
ncbi:phosphotransferase family protein [Mycobacterium sp. ACS4331]|uniref:phosphotransferase family protein n=1 Tax=Mycobacterium sp. ACS4331 TaxID=1834121 RepID=UPI000800FFB9|nr:phosphotransferase family protein [Mycobacterium sp. ACS4331]OBF24856.1 aminoglycoside phosphotransferase [Mycobacterium sp. ACS4331]